MNKRLSLILAVCLLGAGWNPASCQEAGFASRRSSAPVVPAAKDDQRVERAYRFLNEMRPDRAIACLTGPLIEALRLNNQEGNKRAARYLLLCGYAFRLDENDCSALACFKLAKRLNPQDLLAYSLMGETLLRMYAYEEAQQCYKYLEPHASDSYIAARGLALRYAAFQEAEPAKKYILKALSLEPRDPRSRYVLARLLEGEEAAAQYRLAAKYTDSPYMKEIFLWYADNAVDPLKAGRDHLVAAGKILPGDPLWHSKTAISLMRDGRIAEVGAEMQAAARCLRLSTRAYTQYATYLMFDNQRKEAAACLAYLERYRGQSAELYWTKGNLAGLNGDSALAEKEYLKALSLNPRYNQAYSSLLEMSTVKKRADFCLSKAKEWTDNCANLPDGWLYMGNLLRKRQEWQEAIAAYKQAEKEESYSFLERDLPRRLQICAIHAGAGTSYYKAGNLAEAEKEARLFNRFKPQVSGQAMRVRPGLIDFARLKEGSLEAQAAQHGTLADMLYEGQELADCIAEYKKALALQADNIDWHKGLLKAYLDKKDWAAAAQEDMFVSNYMVTHDMPQAFSDWRKKIFP